MNLFLTKEVLYLLSYVGPHRAMALKRCVELPAQACDASSWGVRLLVVFGAGNGTRTRDVQLGRLTLYQLSYSRVLTCHRGAGIGLLVEGGGFEPPKAEPTDLQSAPFGRSGTPPGFGAGDGTRTRNLLITNQLLYRLSYASERLLYKIIVCTPFFLACQDLFALPPPNTVH